MAEYIVNPEEEMTLMYGDKYEQLIRCKNCKYYEETDARIGTCLLTMCGAYPEGYCAWSERAEE